MVHYWMTWPFCTPPTILWGGCTTQTLPYLTELCSLQSLWVCVLIPSITLLYSSVRCIKNQYNTTINDSYIMRYLDHIKSLINYMRAKAKLACPYFMPFRFRLSRIASLPSHSRSVQCRRQSLMSKLFSNRQFGGDHKINYKRVPTN